MVRRAKYIIPCSANTAFFCDKYVRKREPNRLLVRYIYRSEVNGINR